MWTMQSSFYFYLLHFFLLSKLLAAATFPTSPSEQWDLKEAKENEYSDRGLIEQTMPEDAKIPLITKEEIGKMSNSKGAYQKCMKSGLMMTKQVFNVPGLYKFQAGLADENIQQNRPCHTVGPLLCIKRLKIDRVPYPITSQDPENSFAEGIIATTSFPVMGCQISNTAHANAICEQDVGEGFILATGWEGVIDSTFIDGKSGNETIGYEWYETTGKTRVFGGFVALGHLQLKEFDDFWINSSKGNNCWYDVGTNLEGLEYMP